MSGRSNITQKHDDDVVICSAVRTAITKVCVVYQSTIETVVAVVYC